MSQLLCYLKLKEVKSCSDLLLFRAPHAVREGTVRCCAHSCILSPGTVTDRKNAAISWDPKPTPRVCISGAGGEARHSVGQGSRSKECLMLTVVPVLTTCIVFSPGQVAKMGMILSVLFFVLVKHKQCALSEHKLQISPCINMSLLAVLVLNEGLTCTWFCRGIN